MADESAWFKSSHSNDTGGACVEIAALTAQVGMRDSKDPNGPAFVISDTAWDKFIGAVKHEQFRI
ncbi:DUF397 domain-containing protein [Streptomyces sp. NPDC039016]|uniref:DUF397 domain-containing protein n=1 Tax=Streptomyces sp. NPDC039016 TaxID=3154330 RepID=UPI0033C680E9